MLVIGDYNDIGGQVFTVSGNGLSAGGQGADYAIGAFTGTDGLPGEINSKADWENFADALVAKQTQIESGDIDVDLTTRRFVGVGGSGSDFFTIHNHDLALVYGRDGSDAITTEGPNDTLYGGDGDDSLDGGGGTNRLYGGQGADLLHSAGGGDVLSGGAGADRFVFSGFAVQKAAVIADLTNADVIDLGGIDANAATPEDDAFVHVKHFDGAAGEFVVRDKGNGTTVVKFDTDGDGVGDHSIQLKGEHADFTSFAL